MEAPSDTNMDIVPGAGTFSSMTGMMVTITDAMDIFEVQRDSEWQMMGWHIGATGGAAVYHRRGCTMCSTYAAHLMAAYNEGTVWLPNRMIGQAIEMAWPGILHNVGDMAEEWWKSKSNLSKERLKT